MYTEHFGLAEKPFSISPDPRYLYLSQRHADALAHLIYGITESGGFIQLTGEVGTGKTTLIRSLLEQLPENTEVALVLNPPLTTQEFLYSICQELRLDVGADATVKALIDQLNTHLLAANAEDRRVVLIVDEAQTLGPDLLEQVRLLTNLETSKRKLLQIILIGQPELRELLDRPQMRQIAQRITGRYHLEPLTAADARVYVRHRLKVAGSRGDIFSDRAIRELYRLGGGIPRLINVLADRSLLAAYTRDERRVGVRLVRQAAREVFGRPLTASRWPWVLTGAIGSGLIIAGFTLGYLPLSPAGSDEPEPAAVALDTDTDEGTDAALPLTAAADPAPRPPDSLEGVFAAADPAADRLAAARMLLGLWGVELTDGDGCERAATAGLRCVSLPGASLADLKRIDRPVVLELSDAGGRSRSVVLTGLDFDRAEIAIEGRRLDVTIAELARYWFGDHWLLWRPATDVSADLAPGMRSDRVVWLREALAYLRHESVPTTGEPRLFDPALESWVRDYQRLRHLAVDGVVGVETQIALQADVGHRTGPTLGEAH